MTQLALLLFSTLSLFFGVADARAAMPQAAVTRTVALAAPAAAVLPAPFTTLRLAPDVLQPGNPLIVALDTNGATKIEGLFADRPIRFAHEPNSRDGSFVGMLGLDSLFAPGTYTLTLIATTVDGATTRYDRPVVIRRGRYILENIALSPKLTPTLDPAVNKQEALDFQQIYSGYSPERRWSGPFRLPVAGRFSSLYGNRRAYNGINLGTFHGGYDIVAGTGTPVKAAAPGQVVAVREFVVHGLTVVIDHGQGVFTAYSHLSKILVSEGQKVDMGAVIAAVGNTGRSQGAHLHFELAIGGAAVDPGIWTRIPLP